MASINTNISTTAGSGAFGLSLKKFFSGIVDGYEAYALRHSRADEIAALEAKSDAELAQMGIKRDEIAIHVFRGLFYI